MTSEDVRNKKKKIDESRKKNEKGRRESVPPFTKSRASVDSGPSGTAVRT